MYIGGTVCSQVEKRVWSDVISMRSCKERNRWCSFRSNSKHGAYLHAHINSLKLLDGTLSNILTLIWHNSTFWVDRMNIKQGRQGGSLNCLYWIHQWGYQVSADVIDDDSKECKEVTMKITWMRAWILVFQSVFCSLFSGDKISSSSSTCTSESVTQTDRDGNTVTYTQDIIHSLSAQFLNREEFEVPTITQSRGHYT